MMTPKMIDNLKAHAGCMFVNNQYQPSKSAEKLAIVNPATNQQVAQFVSVTDSEVDSVIANTNRAQQQWAALDAKTRASYLHRVADSIEQADHREVAEAMVIEMGKPYPEALGEIANVAPIFRYMAEMARDDNGYIAGTTQQGSFQYAQYFPLGVTAHIMPFNFPILLFAWTAAATLACGNGFIVKPAEATSVTTLMFMRHFTCLPEGLTACVTGNGRVGQRLVDSPNIHGVAFTGSVEVGRRVNTACAQLMKPAVIEAGGNDAMIITDHANYEVAAAGAICGAFHLSGQVCTSAERFFVTEQAYDQFMPRFIEQANALRVGDGFGKHEIGPLVNVAARDRVLGLIERAVAQGAVIECGGYIPKGLEQGAYLAPTILSNVTPDMEIMNAEVFGPVAAVCKVSDFDQAVRYANQSQYGLGACVFTNDHVEATRAGEELQTGMVWVNNPMIDNDALPFGGWKLSGMGRELGRQGLDAFRQSKMIIKDAQPQIHDWWYPYSDEVFYGEQ